jgi:hypothetical protein
MEHTTYASRLRYLDADDVDDGAIDYEGLSVRGPDGHELGQVDGFIVDAQAGRVYYVVVDSGGWFSSRRLLLPVGHAALDTADKALRVDVTREALSHYPEFDQDTFTRFSDQDLRQFESRMVEACCSDEAIDDVSVRSWAYDTRRHYAQPSWWTRDSYPQERLRPVEQPIQHAGIAPPPPIRESHGAELMTARERTDADDVSPHFEGRAQPGDVLGIETGGERTYVGETAEDENKRRRDAERALAKDDEGPRRSDR